MQPGTFTPDDLPTLAREAHEASGRTQADAAAHLGVTPQSYGQALGNRPGLDALRCRIIAEFTDYEADGPHYTLRPKRSA